MQVKRLRSILWFTTAVAGGASVGVLAAAIAWPLDAASQAPAGSAIARTSTTQPAGPVLVQHDLAWYEPAWGRPLRRPLVDPPPPAVPVVQGPARPKIRLIGTIVDGDRPRGVFLTGLNNIEIKRVGESTGGASIVSIDAESATIRFEGQSLQLKREKKPFDPSGESYDAALRSAPTNSAPQGQSDGS